MGIPRERSSTFGSLEGSAPSGWFREGSTPARGMSAIRISVEEEEQAPNDYREDFVRDVSPFAATCAP